MCKGAITKCPVFGSEDSEEVMVLGAQAVSCVSLYEYERIPGIENREMLQCKELGLSKDFII